MKVRTSIDHDAHTLTVEVIPETTVDRDAIEPVTGQETAKVKKNGVLAFIIELKKQPIGRADGLAAQKPTGKE